MLTTEREEMILKEEILQRVKQVREASITMCKPLLGYDEYNAQPFSLASPAAWNLAHTSWISAIMIRTHRPDLWTENDRNYAGVLNSYYASLGDRIAQADRGTLARFDLEELFRYRKSVDQRLPQLIEDAPMDKWSAVCADLELVLHHEAQHQELFYTETLDRRWRLPQFQYPYKERVNLGKSSHTPLSWVGFDSFLGEFGNVEGGFGWDNENVHTRYLPEFQIANRLVTNGEYLEFILAADGVGNELNYLADGWKSTSQGERCWPAYWQKCGESWRQWTLLGWREVDWESPVVHVDFYQAEAFARWKSRQGPEWKGTRLPSEFEWERACRTDVKEEDPKAYLQSGYLMPVASEQSGLVQMLGFGWQWTYSHYEPYYGFVPYEGPFSEYNGKFMNNKRVLRGGSCVSENWHIHPGYRNFWPAETQFQFSCIRLARD